MKGEGVSGGKKLEDYLFYHEPGPPSITIYKGDCLEVMPLLPKVDLVVTDPPYGIGAGQMSFGKWRTSRMQKGDWDSAPGNIEQILKLSIPTIIWGGNYFKLPPSRNWLVWDKGAGFKGRDFAECELAWCSMDGNARIFSRDPLAHRDYHDKQHPTQKPVQLMKWCIQQCKYWDAPLTILDPFGGSGTTAVACKELRKDCILIEISEKYCQIAVNRLKNTIVPMF